jgi:hypothetical protein
MIQEAVPKSRERESFMKPTFLPSTAQLQELFGEEVGALGGTVSDKYNDGRRLYLRAILPGIQEVRPKDKVQGGVALRATGRQVRVHPYVYRQVCRNGAVMAQAFGTRVVDRLEETPFGAPVEYEVGEVLAEIRSVVQACCAPEIFAANTELMRSAVDIDADMLLNTLPGLLQVAEGFGRDVANQILARYLGDGEDRTAFGLMNAVTSLARDTEDPELRWSLEELGGGVPALVRPRCLPSGAAAVALTA